MTEELARWLEALGLEKFHAAFVEQEITLDDLTDLTENDLKEMRLPIGPRRRVLKAIAALAEQDEQEPHEKEAFEHTNKPHLASAAERRQLTVMFCDLVGSTALSRRLDPEDLRGIMRRYQDAVAGAVTRYGGHVAKYLGDGVLVYFGWPFAYEDQAERAVLASLDVVEAVNAVVLSDDEVLSARIGIATGQVVVGELSGETDAITGETPNLAARLQGLANPGEVVIGDLTRLLLGRAFVVDDLGPQDLKGFDDAVNAWRIAGKTVAESRFEAAHDGALLPLSGRTHELGLLLECWGLAKQGKGQVILLSGEAGIGKSRLIQALQDKLADEPHHRLRYQCSPLYRNSAFYPVVRRLEKAAGFSDKDEPDDLLKKLEALLQISGGDASVDAPLFAELMSLAGESRYGALSLTPQQLREGAMEAMIRQVIALSKQRPILFVLEDAHWIDNSTETLIGEIMGRIADLPVIILITYRPDEYVPPWPGLPYSSTIELRRLPHQYSVEIVGAIAQNDLPDDVVDELIQRAEGVPLYLEELTKSLLQSGQEGVPPSLQASLMARIDSLGEAKEIAQTCSVIGREFDFEMLATLLPGDRSELSTRLEQLVHSELVYRFGTGNQTQYVFKHALIQDAAYASLLNTRRHELHGQVARALREKESEVGGQQHEILARHLSASNDHAGAAEQWQLAGQRAALLSALEEAESCYLRGIDEVDMLPCSQSVDRMTFDLRLALASLYFYKEGPQSFAAEEAYLLARDLCKAFDDVELQNAVSWGLWALYWNRGDTKNGASYAYEQIDRLHEGSHPFAISVANRSVAVVEMTLGKFRAAETHARTASQIIASSDDGRTASRYGHDLNVSAHMMLAMVRGLLGHVDDAIDIAKRAMKRARDLGHSPTIGYAAYFTGLLQVLAKCSILQDSELEELNLVKGQVSILGDNWSEILGGMKAIDGDYAEAAALMSPQLELLELSPLRGRGVYGDIAFRIVFAETLLKLGKCNQAISVADTVFKAIKETGFTWWSAEYDRLRGEIAYQTGDLEAATSHYQNALEIANRQSARLFGLRAASSWARLLNQQREQEQALQTLKTALDHMPDGERAPDLRDARALLHELNR